MKHKHVDSRYRLKSSEMFSVSSVALHYRTNILSLYKVQTFAQAANKSSLLSRNSQAVSGIIINIAIITTREIVDDEIKR